MRIKVSYIVHMPGHKGSDGSEKPWVIKSHETGKIISSHSSKAAAEKHLKQIQYFKHKGKLMEFNQIESLDQLIKEADLISKVPIDEKRIDASNIDKQLIRDAIIAELDAINLYEQSAESVSNTKIKEVLLDIAKEEKTHVGELETLLFMIDKEQSNEMLQGVDEVMSKKSFIGYKNLDTLIKIAEDENDVKNNTIGGDISVTLSFPANLYDQNIFYSIDGSTPGVLGIMKTCIEEAEDNKEMIFELFKNVITQKYQELAPVDNAICTVEISPNVIASIYHQVAKK